MINFSGEDVIKLLQKFLSQNKMTAEFLQISIRILARNFNGKNIWIFSRISIRIRVGNAAVKLILGRCAIYHAVDIGICTQIEIL